MRDCERLGEIVRDSGTDVEGRVRERGKEGGRGER